MYFNVLIDSNDTLTSLSGLSSLATVWYSINVTGNSILQDVDCFGILTETVAILISNNTALKGLHGLAFNPELATSLITYVYNNDSLATLGMNALKNIYEMFTFMDNPELCASLIEDLEKQLSYTSRLLSVSTILDNKECG
ncbi:MAG: hypothetical protein KKD44_00740 [Proteobacteria bacterium]|nr:hypothetical protein [Pseudomonadota bacterium]